MFSIMAYLTCKAGRQERLGLLFARPATHRAKGPVTQPSPILSILVGKQRVKILELHLGVLEKHQE